MSCRKLALLSACSLTLAAALGLGADQTTNSDLPSLIAAVAQYQSGQSAEPLQKMEQLLRNSVGKPALRTELEGALVKLLAPSATFEARRFACQHLMVIGTEASLPALADLLKKEETVGIACLALGGQRSPKASEVLRNALASARGQTRLQIISALGNHADARSAQALAELARSEDSAIAEAATLALGKMGNMPAQQAIVALLKETRLTQIRALNEAALRVAEQLASAGNRQAASAMFTEVLQPKAPTNIRRGAFAKLLQLDQDGGEQRILDTLNRDDAELTPVAIARVASLKSDGASRKFAALLPKLSPSAQEWLIAALASRGDAEARTAIVAALSATDVRVRRAAINAAGKVGDISAVGILAKMLERTKLPEELQDLELALVSLRGGGATDRALVAQLKPSSTEGKFRLFLVLARRGARVAVPALLEEAASPDTATAQAAFQTLGKIAAGDDLAKLLDRLVNLKAPGSRSEAESAAVRTLARISNTSQSSETVRAALAKSSDIDARCSLLRLLPHAGDTYALIALSEARRDQEPRIRDAAVRALAAWPDSFPWRALLTIFFQPENDTHRSLALRALTRMAVDRNTKPNPELIGDYRRLLAAARDDEERKLILSALAGAAHPEALKLALALLPNAGIRPETELAVRKIAESIKTQHPQAAQAALDRLKK